MKPPEYFASCIQLKQEKRYAKWMNYVFFLLNLYGKFRGKEFVRAYMGSGKKSLELGIRQTTAVLSNPDRKSNDSDEYVKLKEVMTETVLETSLDMNNN